MTHEELNKLFKLNEQFIVDCNRVCSEMKRLEYDYRYIDTFYLDGETVIGEGDEYWSYGGHEHHTVTFDSELLTFSNMELEAYVNNELAEKEEKMRKQQQEEDKEQREKDIKLFNELKEKLGL